jgi:predicted GIY-YIG superfamily endonuclease
MPKQPADAHRRGPRSLLKKYRQGLLCMPLDVSLNGSVAFRHTRHMLVPEQPGVYLIHDLRGVLYVGRSVNLYRRFDQHYWLTDNRLLSLAMRQSFGEMTFSWVLVEDEAERANLESRLISWLRPACNRLVPYANDESIS